MLVKGKFQLKNERLLRGPATFYFPLSSIFPFVAFESVVVRNVGRLKEEDEKHPFDVLYSSPSALYPVGYSCDRYEFSPIHGRDVTY